MTRLLVTCALSAAMALTAGAASMADRQSQKPLPAAVSGVITDGATNLPIAGASVEISRTDGGRTLIKRVNADSKGRFVLTDVSSAVGYWLTGSATGYVSSDYGWEPGASDAFNNRFTSTWPIFWGLHVTSGTLP